jgi:AcrR family transcriptional regulator
MEEERRIYAAVRALLLDYGGSGLTLKDVAEMLHVEERKITHLVNSGYFNLSMRRLWPTDRRNDE